MCVCVSLSLSLSKIKTLNPNNTLRVLSFITMMMRPPPLLVNCSNCQTPLQLPAGATAIRCALCQAVTHIADHRNAPPPPSAVSQSYAPPPPSPSPYSHAPPGPPPNAHGRKKAVIVGISYRYSRHELKGCINDAKCMKYLLINKFQFPQESILMLTGTTPCCLNVIAFFAF